MASLTVASGFMPCVAEVPCVHKHVSVPMGSCPIWSPHEGYSVSEAHGSAVLGPLVGNLASIRACVRALVHPGRNLKTRPEHSSCLE